MAGTELLVTLTAKDGISSVLDSVTHKLDNTHKATIAVGVGLAAMGGALAVTLGQIGKVAADFEQSMSNVKAVLAPAEVAQFSGALNDLALKLGKDTVFSANEAAQALEELVKGGVKVPDILNGAAAAALNLASAGGVDLKTAAEIASNALNMFALSGKDMAHVADLIAGAANASSMEVNDFKFALAQSGAVANLTGLSFDDTAIAISSLAAAGLKGSDAGTSLKAMLVSLVPSSKEAIAEFRNLGIITADGANKFFDASGKVKSYAEIAQVLQTALSGMTEQQKIAALHTGFGTDAMRAAAIAAKAGAEGVNEMAAAMGAVSASEVAKTRLDNLNGSIKQLQGSAETLAIMIGSKMAPGFRSLVDAATGVLNKLIELPEPIQASIGQIALMTSGVLLLSGGVVALGAALPMITAALATFGISIAAILGPIALVTAGLAAGILAWNTDFLGFRTTVESTIENLAPVFDRIGTLVQGVGETFSLIGTQISAVFGPSGASVEGFSGVMQEASNQIIAFAHDTAIPALNAFAEAARADFLAFMEAATNMWVAIQPTLMELRDWLTTNIPTAITTVREAWTALSAELGPTFSMAWQVIQPVLIALKDWLGEQIPKAVEFVKSAIGGLFSLIGTVVGALANLLAPLAEQFGGALSAFNAQVQTALTAMIPMVAAVAQEAGGQTRQAFVQGVAPVVPELQEVGVAGAKALAAGLAGGQEAVAVAATRLMSGAKGNIAAAITQAVTEGNQAAVEALLREQGMTQAITQSLQGLTAARKAEIMVMQQQQGAETTLRHLYDSGILSLEQYQAALHGVVAQIKAAAPAAAAAGHTVGVAGAQGIQAGLEQGAAEVKNTAARVGISMAQGVAAGMTSNQGNMNAAFGGILVRAIDSAKDSIGAHSPSTLTAEEIGRPMAEGIGLGFSHGFAMMREAIGSAMDLLTDNMGVYAREAAHAFDANFIIGPPGDHISRALTGAFGSAATMAAQNRVTSQLGNRDIFNAYQLGDPGGMEVLAQRQAEAFQAAQRQSTGQQDLTQIMDPRTGVLYKREEFEKLATVGVQNYAALMRTLYSNAPLAHSASTPGQYGGYIGFETPNVGSQQLAERLAFGGGGGGGSGYQGSFRQPGDVLNGAGQFTSGSGFAQAPAKFVFNNELIASGSREYGSPESAAFMVQQYGAYMAANAAALRENTATVASIPGAFSAFALTVTPGLGNSAVSTGGSGAFGVAGNTPGGASFGALQALNARVLANHPELSGEAQARALQQAMRTDREYTQQVGRLTDTTSDLDRQQAEVTNDIFALQSAMHGLGNAYAEGTGMAQQLRDAQARLIDLTNAAAVAPTPTAPTPINPLGQGQPMPTTPGTWVVGPNGQGWALLNPSLTFPTNTQVAGGIGSGSMGGSVMPVAPSTLTVPPPAASTGGVNVGDINVTVNSSAATTAQEAAELARQVREELRRQGVDVTRLGGV